MWTPCSLSLTLLHFVPKPRALNHAVRASEVTVPSPFQRINPSAEMVMIDRMFNQEERASLSRDKRLALVDPGKNHQGTGRVQVGCDSSPAEWEVV